MRFFRDWRAGLFEVIVSQNSLLLPSPLATSSTELCITGFLVNLRFLRDGGADPVGFVPGGALGVNIFVAGGGTGASEAVLITLLRLMMLLRTTTLLRIPFVLDLLILG